MKFLPLLIVCLAVSGGAAAQSFPLDLQQDHISANVPSQDDFASYLERDLLAYFRSDVSPDIVSITSSLLRDGATQSGVAYPKFYLWVGASTASGSLVQGAMRVAAIDRERFHVTDFIPSTEILADPTLVTSTFPAPLVSTIMARAEHK